MSDLVSQSTSGLVLGWSVVGSALVSMCGHGATLHTQCTRDGNTAKETWTWHRKLSAINQVPDRSTNRYLAATHKRLPEAQWASNGTKNLELD